MVDEITEHVQVAFAPPDRRDLDGGHDPHAHLLRRLEGLLDAADRVVVGQRQQLDPRRCRPRIHVGRDRPALD